MRLGYSKSKNTIQFYVIKDMKKKGKRSTKIIKKLGNLEEVTQKANGQDPFVWAKNYINDLNKKEENNNLEIIPKLSSSKKIKKYSQKKYNCGYLFLQKFYYDLQINKICNEISKKYKFEYDLNQILSHLLYTRILFPSSKLSSYESAQNFFDKPTYKIQHIYRALEVLAKETDYIQTALYKNSLNVIERNSRVLYYDCTNYFFEIEQEEGIKRYGASKEHRPNPIVQMGLLMDGNGFPLAFVINSGNTNEQTTIKPLEQQIIKDFELSEFVLCTDAGLASTDNRKFNTIQNRSYIVSQSLKKIKGHIRQWSLSKTGWHTLNNPKGNINLEEIKNDVNNDEIYYKETWINENGLEQRLIVTYSPKYAEYQKNIRENQIIRAKEYIKNPTRITHIKQTDPKRFVKTTKVTDDGEIAENRILTLNEKAIEQEAQYDGYYAVCTTLEDDVTDIIKVNKRRWEIEESFRILKTELKSRPVYLKRDDRIKAHFTTCFLSLVLYRVLESKIKSKNSCEEIIKTLRDMNLSVLNEEGYLPAYTRTDLTDELHNIVKFRTDTEVVTNKALKEIIKKSKNEKTLRKNK